MRIPLLLPVVSDRRPVVAFIEVPEPGEVDFPVVAFPVVAFEPVVAELDEPEGLVAVIQAQVPLTTTKPSDEVKMRVIVWFPTLVGI